MSAKKNDTKSSWVDPDEPPEWPDEVWERAQFSVGGEVVRAAEGTLSRRGRPPVGDAAKQQVTLRLAPAVLEHFKSQGPGWQTRLNAVLERHVKETQQAYKGPAEKKR
jgi:uncharacterized protein (DUF4415 family)